MGIRATAPTHAHHARIVTQIASVVAKLVARYLLALLALASVPPAPLMAAAIIHYRRAAQDAAHTGPCVM